MMETFAPEAKTLPTVTFVAIFFVTRATEASVNHIRDR